MFSKQLKLAAVALALGAAGAHAATVGLPVTIEEKLGGTNATSKIIVADQLSGQYDEVVTFHSATQFSTAAIFNASKWFYNGGVVTSRLSSDLSEFGVDWGYNIYAKFIGSGTYFTDGTNTSFSATYNKIELWMDRDQNTTYSIVGQTASAVPSFNDIVLTSAATTTNDDLLLGTASLTLAADGNSTGSGLANGNFEILFGDFKLEAPNGEAYFIAPRPFHIKLDLNGNFQSFIPSAGASVYLLNNSANAFFVPVPEPGALALVGAAFLAVGVASKRRKSA